MLNTLGRRLRQLRDEFKLRSTTGRRDSDSQSASTSLPPVPSLPSERARILTPSVSQESLCQAVAAATADCSFFQKLPYEIRRKILVEAFGGHIIHMDLFFDHPEMPLIDYEVDYEGKKIIPHCNRNTIKMSRFNGPYTHMDTSKPKRYFWRSSECHRDHPRIMMGPHRKRYFSNSLNAAEDRCRLGGTQENFCSAWRGADYSKCFVGAMGWMLSCRQAYSEGIDVLYRTNTIHSASQLMLFNLDKILIPQRLSAISSVELVWDFDPFLDQTKSTEPFRSLKALHEFLAALPELLPHLRSLHLCLQGNLLPRVENGGYWSFADNEESRTLIDTHIMNPVDEMVGRLSPGLEDCTVALAASLYSRLRDLALAAGDKVDQVHLGAMRERLWRSLPATTCDRDGYWVEVGKRDWQRLYVCTMGEGLPPGFYPEELEVFYPPWHV